MSSYRCHYTCYCVGDKYSCCHYFREQKQKKEEEEDIDWGSLKPGESPIQDYAATGEDRFSLGMGDGAL